MAGQRISYESEDTFDLATCTHHAADVMDAKKKLAPFSKKKKKTHNILIENIGEFCGKCVSKCAVCVSQNTTGALHLWLTP